MKLDLIPLAARTDLIPTLADWFRQEWSDDFADRDAGELLEAQAQTDQLPIALVVLADGEPAGTVALKKDSIDAFDHLEPWVGGLYVHPDFRGLGIARLLVSSAARVARALEYDAVYTGTHAVELFEALGWERVDEGEQSGEPVTILRYEQPADPPSYYEQLGGEEVVRALVDRFYDLMDEKAEASDIRKMHAKSLKASRQKLFEFLCGWLGGPNLYVERRGHPRLRARHLPFEIGTEARDQWLGCMDQALDDVVEDEQLREKLSDSFTRIADHMRNRRGP